MNLVRSIISLFLLVLIGLTIAGWAWAGGLPPDKMAGARLVLAVSGLSALGSLVLLWTVKEPEEHGGAA